jgi:hypothetical protein
MVSAQVHWEAEAKVTHFRQQCNVYQRMYTQVAIDDKPSGEEKQENPKPKKIPQASAETWG